MPPSESEPPKDTPKPVEPNVIPFPGVPIPTAPPASTPPQMAAASSTAPIGINIDDVNASTWAYIKSKKRWQFVGMVAGTLIYEVAYIILLLKVSANSTGNNSNAGKGLAFPIVLIAAWYARIKQKFEDEFLEEFARVNGFAFSKTGSI